MRLGTHYLIGRIAIFTITVAKVLHLDPVTVFAEVCWSCSLTYRCSRLTALESGRRPGIFSEF